uniref:BTB domain-containing protein n=1 Tax=Caenorhabditis tropicalis TaxID=1561998 RepID=A0A1I7UQF2_9PELO
MKPQKVQEPTHSRFGINNNFPIDVILMQPTTSHETFLERSDYVDFESRSRLRNWPISVGEKIFYVDAAIFSKHSEYFRILMENTTFVENTNGLLKIQDESPEDILTLISVLSPNSLGLYPDAIDERNVCKVLRLSDKYLMGNLKHNCIDYLREYRPNAQCLSDTFHLFYHLCFSLNVEYEHDATLADVAIEAMYSCLSELSNPQNVSDFYQFLLNLQKSSSQDEIVNLKRVADAVLHGGAIFRHRISFNEEVQGLGCHQCSMRPRTRQSRSKNSIHHFSIKYILVIFPGKPFILSLCKSCNREVCAQCRRSLCPSLFEEWINELRS